MPYNLRKRTRPDPTPETTTSVKKQRVEKAALEPKGRSKIVVQDEEPPMQIDKPTVAAKKKTTTSTTVTKKTKVETKKPEKPTRKSKIKEIKENHVDEQEQPQPSPPPPPTLTKDEHIIDTKEQIVKITDAVKEDEPSGRHQMVFGSDSCGELGLGKIGITRKNPARVPLDDPIQQVACGPMHTLSLTDNGKIYSYGCNDEGALGRITDGDEELEATPTIVPISNKIIKVTAGDSHSAVLTEKNEVFIWGNFRDSHGSVGLTPACEAKATFKPIQILRDVKFKDIASGSNHMLLLDTKSNVYSFGVGTQGQLGRLKPEEVGKDNDSNPITAENRDLFLTPQIVKLDNVDPQRTFVCDAIYAGNFSSFATNTDKKKNRLAGWGLNNYFQLGYKGQKGQLVQYYPKRSTFTCSTSMSKVACGQHHTLFLTQTGRVYSAGRHDYGMLGLGKQDKEVCPAQQVIGLDGPMIDISSNINTSFTVSKDGKLFAWGMGGTNLGFKGEDDIDVPTEVKSFEGKKVISVSAGVSYTAVLLDQ